MKRDPQATFLMTAWNAARHIGESIESVLRQTEKEFILIIVDDASIDATPEIISSFADSRIRFIRNESNLGTAGASNTGLNQVETPFLLRIDSDDLCLPNRLETQLKFMRAHPSIGVCGSYVEFFGSRSGTWKMPAEDAEIRSRLLWDNVIANSSACIRMEILKNHSIIYHGQDRKPPLEDYQLWIELLPFAHFANIPQVLVHKREHDLSQSTIHKTKEIDSLKAFYQWMFAHFGFSISGEETELHLLGKIKPVHLDRDILQRYKDWQEKLITHFSGSGFMDEEALRKAAGWKWKSLMDFIRLTDIQLLKEYISLSENKAETTSLFLRKKVKRKGK